MDDSQVVDYEFRHDDGRADELPLGQVKILFAPANSALGSSFEKLSPALPYIFGQAQPDHCGNKILRCIKFTFNNGNRNWPRFVP